MTRNADTVAVMAALNSILIAMGNFRDHVDARFDRLDGRIDQIVQDIAGIKVDLATHRHEGD